jgi:dolichol-phosphate mannosyltransferase
VSGPANSPGGPRSVRPLHSQDRSPRFELGLHPRDPVDSAPYIAVIDGDLQHDDSLLPRMLEVLKQEQVDVVVASRYMSKGGADGLSTQRRQLSRAGVWLGQLLVKTDIADPVRGVFHDSAGNRERSGAPIIGCRDKDTDRSFDILATRTVGDGTALSVSRTMLDWFTVLEYLALLPEKVSGHYLHSKFLLFGLVGASGMVVHLAMPRILLAAEGTGFVGAQSLATATAMVWNYFLNTV